MLEFWRSDSDGKITNLYIQLLYRNSLQVLRIVKATYGDEEFRPVSYNDISTEHCSGDHSGRQRLSCLWRRAQSLLLQSSKHGDVSIEEQIEALRMFLDQAQDELSTTSSTYNVPRLVGGASIAGLATVLALLSLPIRSLKSASMASFAAMTALYGIMMFATSYVEEEQHFWYWTTGGWFTFLTASRLSKSKDNQKLTILCSTTLLALHRLMTRWNQTGQKWAGSPDISRTFFPENTYVLWILILATYGHIGLKIARNSLGGLLPTSLAVFMAASTVLPALLFKLNFAAADAPELVGNLGVALQDMIGAFTLVDQARVVFAATAVLIATVLLGIQNQKMRSSTKPTSQPRPSPTMAARLHPILTLFLITQTRVNNVPLFLIFDGQLQLLSYLTTTVSSSSTSTPSSSAPKTSTHNLITIISTTTLLLSYTSYFALGGSNAISSIDLSNAYNGISGYNIGAVGVLLFVSNWAGSIWWTSSGIILLHSARRSLNDGSDTPRATEEPLIRALAYLVTPTEKVAEPHAPKTRDWVQAEHAHLSAAANISLSTVSPVGTTTQTSSQQSFFLSHYGLQTLFTTFSLTAVMVACTLLRTHLFIWTVFSPKFLYAMAWGIGVQGIVFGGLGGLWWSIGF